MNDFLFSYLDNIDEHLLGYLDDEAELSVETADRLQLYVAALLHGLIEPVHVWEDWSDWYQLISAFVATYCPDEFVALEERACFLCAIDEGRDPVLSEEDRTFLAGLELQLDMYEEIRRAR